MNMKPFHGDPFSKKTANGSWSGTHHPGLEGANPPRERLCHYPVAASHRPDQLGLGSTGQVSEQGPHLRSLIERRANARHDVLSTQPRELQQRSQIFLGAPLHLRRFWAWWLRATPAMRYDTRINPRGEVPHFDLRKSSVRVVASMRLDRGGGSPRPALPPRRRRLKTWWE